MMMMMMMMMIMAISYPLTQSDWLRGSRICLGMRMGIRPRRLGER